MKSFFMADNDNGATLALKRNGELGAKVCRMLSFEICLVC